MLVPSYAQVNPKLKAIDITYGLGDYHQAIVQYHTLAERYKSSNKDIYVQALTGEVLAGLREKKSDDWIFERLKAAELTAQDKAAPLKETTLTRLNIALGKYHIAYREHNLALPLLKKALKQSKEMEADLPPAMHVELNRTLGDFYYDRSSYPEALKYYNNAVSLLEKQPAEQTNLEELVNLKIKVGEVHDKILEPQEAIVHYKNVLDKKDSLLSSSPEKIGLLYYRVGKVYFDVKEYETAESYLEKSLEYNLDPKDYADAKFMLSIVYKDQKKYPKALELNGDALDYWGDKPQKLPAENFEAFLQFGGLSRKQSDVKKALNYFKKVTQKDEKWSWKEGLKEAKEEKISYLPNPKLSVNYNVALLSYSHANALIPKLVDEKQPVATIELHMAKGALFFEAKNYTRAKAHYETALRLMEEIYSKKHPLVAEASRCLSEVYLEEKIFDQALKFVNAAVNASLEGSGSVDPKAIPNITQAKFPFELLYAIGTKAKILLKQSKENKNQALLLQALKTYDIAMQLLHKLRRSYRKEGAKYQLSELTLAFSHGGASAAYELYQLSNKRNYLQELFNYIEGAKSSILLGIIQDLKARKIAGIPDSIIQSENQLKISIAYLRSEIYYELKRGIYKDVERLAELRADLKEKEQAHEALIAVLEQKHEKYFKMKYDYSTIGLSVVEEGMEDNKLMLQYLVLDSTMLVLTVAKNKTNCYAVQVTRRQIKYLIKQFSAAVMEDKAAAIQSKGYQLYQLLLKPIESELKAQDLIVIPDDFLNNLAFEILPVKADALDYFVNYNAVCYNYSASVFWNSKMDLLETANASIMAWAPDFNILDSLLKSDNNYSDAISKLGIKPLPYALKEATALSEMFGSPALSGKEATETHLKQYAKDYRVLHFATHGIINNEFPLFSSLAFLVDKQNDGLLYTHELYNMQLNAEMVTLSACNSGLGALHRGEGVMSIARGFAYSGVPNVVMSLWEIPDQATQVVMEQFYQNLKQGMAKHKAMQQAKISFLKDIEGSEGVPRLWGGFVVLGNTKTVDCLVGKQTINWWIWIGALLGISLFVGVFIKNRK